MTDTESSCKDENPSFVWRRWYTVVLLLFFLLLATIMTIDISASRQEKRVNEKMTAIRKAGYPATPAELDKWYPAVPAGENAALLLEAAFRLFVTTGPDMQHVPICGPAVEFPKRTNHLPPEIKKASVDYLDLNKNAIKLLHEGAALPKSRYPIVLSSGYLTTLPDLSNIRQGVRLLALEALVYADAGNSAAATKDLLSIFGVARSLDNEPVFISQLVRIACNALILANLEIDLNLVSFSDSELEEISHAIEDAENCDGFYRGLVGERCIGYDFYKDPNFLQLRTGSVTTPSTSLPSSLQTILDNMRRSFYKKSGMLAYDFSLYLDYLAEYIDACKTPFPKRLQMVSEISKKMNSITTALSSKTLAFHIFLNNFPAFDRSIQMDARNIASLRTARMAIAVERYRLATGKLPADAKDLVPKYLKTIPIDPFDPTEKTLRYAKLKTGFIIYSVGDDGKDDGGTEFDATGRKYSLATDITFILEH
jgi:hypothetical protein